MGGCHSKGDSHTMTWALVRTGWATLQARLVMFRSTDCFLYSLEKLSCSWKLAWLPEKQWYLWPAERKPGTSRKYWIRVRGNFIRTGRFPAKLRLLHQGVTGGLHCIILNYEARLCYYKDAISLNSQAGQWNTGARCYGQLKHAFSKKAISQASSLYTVVFLSIETM